MKKLHPDFIRKTNLSGICHHMIFQKKILQEIFNKVEIYHNNGKPFYRIFLEMVADHMRPHSGSSEYELYFHYIHTFHPDSFELRKLSYTDSSYLDGERYAYVAWHWYM